MKSFNFGQCYINGIPIKFMVCKEDQEYLEEELNKGEEPTDFMEDVLLGKIDAKSSHFYVDWKLHLTMLTNFIEFANDEHKRVVNSSEKDIGEEMIKYPQVKWSLSAASMLNYYMNVISNIHFYCLDKDPVDLWRFNDRIYLHFMRKLCSLKLHIQNRLLKQRKFIQEGREKTIELAVKSYDDDSETTTMQIETEFKFEALDNPQFNGIQRNSQGYHRLFEIINNLVKHLSFELEIQGQETEMSITAEKVKCMKQAAYQARCTTIQIQHILQSETKVPKIEGENVHYIISELMRILLNSKQTIYKRLQKDQEKEKEKNKQDNINEKRKLDEVIDLSDEDQTQNESQEIESCSSPYAKTRSQKKKFHKSSN